MNIYVVQLVNYTLSFLMWMIIGRGVLMLFTGGKENFITTLFAKITDPVYAFVRKLVPFSTERSVPLYSLVIIIIIRFVIILIFKPGSTPH